MKKKMYFWLVATMLMIPAVASAQEMEYVDSIEVDTIDVDYVINGDDIVLADSVKITQYTLSECDGVEVCKNPKYTIVIKDGKKGIYDMVLGKNVTEIEFQEVVFSRSEEIADEIPSSWFFVRREKQKGILCVYEDDDSVMTLWMDDSDEDSSDE